jgi:hypothetical protein
LGVPVYPPLIQKGGGTVPLDALATLVKVGATSCLLKLGEKISVGRFNSTYLLTDKISSGTPEEIFFFGCHLKI